MNNIPVIRVQLEGLRHSVQHAFSEEMLQYDEYVQKALEEALEPNKIAREITRLAELEVQHALKKAVEDYFKFGDGWVFIKEEASEMLNRSFESRKDLCDD